jgi:hypothetical protein
MTGYWTPAHDTYGRSASKLVTVKGATVGVIVKLPKAYTAKYGATYLSNDWTQRGEAAVRYHESISAAKARLEAIAKAL